MKKMQQFALCCDMNYMYCITKPSILMPCNVLHKCFLWSRQDRSWDLKLHHCRQYRRHASCHGDLPGPDRWTEGVLLQWEHTATSHSMLGVCDFCMFCFPCHSVHLCCSCGPQLCSICIVKNIDFLMHTATEIFETDSVLILCIIETHWYQLLFLALTHFI